MPPRYGPAPAADMTIRDGSEQADDAKMPRPRQREPDQDQPHDDDGGPAAPPESGSARYERGQVLQLTSAELGLAVRPRRSPAARHWAPRFVVPPLVGVHRTRMPIVANLLGVVGQMTYGRRYGIAIYGARNRHPNVRISNPDRCTSERGETKLDLAQYYIAVSEGNRPGAARAAVHAAPLPDGWPARRSTRNGYPGRSGLGRDRRGRVPVRTHRRQLCVTELASVIWQCRCPPSSSTRALAAGRHRASGRAAHRPRPQPGTDSPSASRWRSRARVLDELGAVGWPRRPVRRACTCTCGSSRLRLQGGAPGGAGLRPRGRAAHPDLVTTKWWKEERGEQIFLDYNQNARDRTIASAYSVRGRPHGPVSAPVTWAELPDVEMADFTIATCRPGCRAGRSARGIDDAVWSIAPLLGWRPRRARPRPGRRPYPPNYPKMPRTTPRAALEDERANWTDDGQPAVNPSSSTEIAVFELSLLLRSVRRPRMDTVRE